MTAAAGGTRPADQAGEAEREAPEISLHAPLPSHLEIGLGQFLVVSGECRDREGRRIVDLEIALNGRPTAAELSPAEGGVAFWQALFIPPRMAGETASIEALATIEGGGRARRRLGDVLCRVVARDPAPVPEAAAGADLVAICMAAYRPDPEAFRRQVESIRAQTHLSWVCLVNDDGTPDDEWRRMKEICAGDERFLLFRNPENLGFYRNFERALTRVPDQADYVAFADQDDAWYPEKLAALVDALKADDAQLAYSDMRIVDEDGREVAPTYWVNRRNEYRDLPVVLVANTITGAASVFRRGLLEYLVPFPPRVGDAFHDHWLACLSMSVGRLAYVDRPLYDYYQYGGSVIGHCDFVRFTLAQRAASLVRFLFRMCRPSVAGPLLRGKYASALAIYRGECRRLRLVEDTILERCPVAPGVRKKLGLFDGGPRSLLRLLGLHARVLVGGQTTDDAELRLAMGEAARIVERRRLKTRRT